VLNQIKNDPDLRKKINEKLKSNSKGLTDFQ